MPTTLDASELDWLNQPAALSAGDGWNKFLEHHAGLVLSIIRQYQHEPQQINDCYLFICEQLSDADFKRLRTWQPRAGATFSAWLRAVVARLCVDWHRAQNGRIRPPKLVTQMGALEQRVFTLRFAQRLGITECLELLRADYPNLSELRLAEIIGRLSQSLSSEQHWRLKTRQEGFLSLNDMESGSLSRQIPDAAPTAEEQAIRDEQAACLNAALQHLSDTDRLLLRLRYEQDLTLQQIAQLTGLDGPFQARYRIHQALKKLERQLQD